MSSLSASLNLGQNLMIKYCHTTIFILGTIGSSINILLFSQSSLRSNSCCIYFLASFVSALILLSMGIIPQIYAQFHSMNPFTTIDGLCKSRAYLNQTSAMLCRWLLVLACVDRCFSCSTNVSIRYYSSSPIARRVIPLTISIWLLFPIHTLIYSNIQHPGNIACSITNTDVALYHRFYTVIMGGIFPTSISFVCCLFIWKYFQNRRIHLVRRPSNARDRRKKKRDEQVLLMLLIQVFIFLISTIPFMSYNIYDTLSKSITDKSINRKSIESFIKTLTELLVYFITLTFYSNTIVSKTFRKELVRFCAKIRHGGRVRPSQIGRPNVAQITRRGE